MTPKYDHTLLITLYDPALTALVSYKDDDFLLSPRFSVENMTMGDVSPLLDLEKEKRSAVG